jgi:RNase H-fold protein (predicted Holliday junction resolvase)
MWMQQEKKITKEKAEKIYNLLKGEDDISGLQIVDERIHIYTATAEKKKELEPFEQIKNVDVLCGRKVKYHNWSK